MKKVLKIVKNTSMVCFMEQKAEEYLAKRVRRLREGRGGPWFDQPKSKAARKSLVAKINELFADDGCEAMKLSGLENIETGRKGLSLLEAMRISVALNIPLLEIVIDPYDPFSINKVVPELGLTNIELYRLQCQQAHWDDAFFWADRLLDALVALEESNRELPPSKAPHIPIAEDQWALFRMSQRVRGEAQYGEMLAIDVAKAISDDSGYADKLHAKLMKGSDAASIREREQALVGQVCRGVHQLGYYSYKIPAPFVLRICNAIKVSESKWLRAGELSVLDDVEVQQDFKNVEVE